MAVPIKSKPVFSSVFSSQADAAASVLAKAYAALDNKAFRDKMVESAQRAQSYAQSNGKHDKAFEFKMLVHALQTY